MNGVKLHVSVESDVSLVVVKTVPSSFSTSSSSGVQAGPKHSDEMTSLKNVIQLSTIFSISRSLEKFKCIYNISINRCFLQ